MNSGISVVCVEECSELFGVVGVSVGDDGDVGVRGVFGEEKCVAECVGKWCGSGGFAGENVGFGVEKVGSERFDEANGVFVEIKECGVEVGVVFGFAEVVSDGMFPVANRDHRAASVEHKDVVVHYEWLVGGDSR